MGNLTTASTQSPYSVQGNRRVVLVEVGSTGGSTSDTVSVSHLSAVTAFWGARFTSAAAGYDTTHAANPPQLFLG